MFSRYVKQISYEVAGERGGLVVNASDSGSRGRGFEPRSGQTVLCPCARRIHSPKVLVMPRKRWLRPNITEKLFTGMLRINQPNNEEADLNNFNALVCLRIRSNLQNIHQIYTRQKKKRNSKIFPLSFPFNAKMLIVKKY